MKRTAATIIREYGPFPGVDHVHGLTFDGRHVWFAAGDKLIALDPGEARSLDDLEDQMEHVEIAPRDRLLQDLTVPPQFMIGVRK